MLGGGCIVVEIKVVIVGGFGAVLVVVLLYGFEAAVMMA